MVICGVLGICRLKNQYGHHWKHLWRSRLPRHPVLHSIAQSVRTVSNCMTAMKKRREANDTPEFRFFAPYPRDLLQNLVYSHAMCPAFLYASTPAH